MPGAEQPAAAQPNGVQVAGQGGTLKPLNSHYTSMPTTIFEVMSKLAAKHGSVNLGQGFPDDELEGPASMKEVASSALHSHSNQYPPLLGLTELRQALARHSKRYYGLEVDPQTSVVVTAGATEALAAAFLALAEEGDEVVVFDPMYDSYIGMARRLGVKLVPVPLQLPGLGFDPKQLAAAFGPRTKFMLLNCPHNPTGKVFTREELDQVAALVERHNTYAVLDEVYEHLSFPGSPHTSLAQLPRMAPRCLRIGSAGKTFSFTSWKVGWAVGPPAVMAALAKSHQFLTFTVPSAMQRGVAHGLDQEQAFYGDMGSQLATKRQYLKQRLEAIGFQVLPAQGTYFMLADFRPLLPHGAAAENDVHFAHRLTSEAGVTVIPVSAFYLCQESAPRHLVRFCFCKTDAKLQRACDLMESYFGSGRRLE